MNQNLDRKFTNRPPFEPNSRQAAILKVIAETGFAETGLMAKFLSKTPQTIRRDFKELETHGLVKQIFPAPALTLYGKTTYRTICCPAYTGW